MQQEKTERGWRQRATFEEDTVDEHHIPTVLPSLEAPKADVRSGRPRPPCSFQRCLAVHHRRGFAGSGQPGKSSLSPPSSCLLTTEDVFGSGMFPLRGQMRRVPGSQRTRACRSGKIHASYGERGPQRLKRCPRADNRVCTTGKWRRQPLPIAQCTLCLSGSIWPRWDD